MHINKSNVNFIIHQNVIQDTSFAQWFEQATISQDPGSCPIQDPLLMSSSTPV